MRRIVSWFSLLPVGCILRTLGLLIIVLTSFLANLICSYVPSPFSRILYYAIRFIMFAPLVTAAYYAITLTISVSESFSPSPKGLRYYIYGGIGLAIAVITLILCLLHVVERTFSDTYLFFYYLGFLVAVRRRPEHSLKRTAATIILVASILIFSVLLVVSRRFPAVFQDSASFDSSDTSYSSSAVDSSYTAAESGDVYTVYVTQSGAKYHRKNCPAIRDRNVTALSLEDAIANDYEPCKKCNP